MTKSLRYKFAFTVLLLTVGLTAAPMFAQTKSTDDVATAKTAVSPESAAKAEGIVQKAIQKLGGERYLAVRTSIGRGFYTPYQKEEAETQQTFVDYIVFPDKERTEFKSGGIRTIQTNVSSTGWIYDGGARQINDQTPEQVANFKSAIRTSLDFFLRGEWRKISGAQLEYVGRREAGVGRRNEVVRVIYPDDLTIEFEFAATDGMPQKTVYKRPNTGGDPTKEEDRFAQWVDVGGVLAPFIIDHFRDGKQTSRVNYESIQFNQPIADALFAKPTDVKKLKN